MIRVVFVCLGNICRSPMAEGVFRNMVEEVGLRDKIQVDSAGTSSWHIGEPAHRGTRDILAKHGIQYQGRARRVRGEDYNDSNYVIAMDKSNLEALRSYQPEHPRMYLLLDFANQVEKRDVPDPYYSGNFEEVYQLVKAGCSGLLEAIRVAEKL